MKIADFLSRLKGVTGHAPHWEALCPAHEDNKPSLSVTETADRILVNCHAGCSVEAVVDAVGLTLADLFTTNGPKGPEIVAAYDYTDENNNVLFQVVRYMPKGFKQRRPDGAGGWVWNLHGVRRVLYRLPQLRTAIAAGEPIHLPEGEKDVLSVVAAGGSGTCSPGGAGTESNHYGWRSEYTEALRGAHVVVVADRDKAGYAHARAVASALQGVATRVELVEPLVGKDVTDHLAAGKTLAELVPVPLAPPVDQQTQQVHASPDEPAESGPHWPATVASEAYYGLAGEIVRAISPQSEADPVAVLIQFLAIVGNIVGRGPHYPVEGHRHYAAEYVLAVGDTAVGRKGTAWAQAVRLLRIIAPEWAAERLTGGLSSGEGLVWAVRDEIRRTEPVRDRGKPTGTFHEVCADPGISDKRLMLYETEFASVLGVMTRQGNTLSPILRAAWDGVTTLRTLVKHDPAQATDPHISLVAHITPAELQARLDRTDAANGLANRFLIVCARRSKLLPDGGTLTDADLEPLAKRLASALLLAEVVGEMKRSPEARELWHEMYPELTAGRPGLLGAVLSRAEAHVLRLSMIYALLDGAAVIEPAHLLAARAVWEYCAASAEYVFGDALGDPIADRILSALRAAGQDGLDRSELYDTLDRHVRREVIAQKLALLEGLGLATWEREPTDGRPREVWRATACRVPDLRDKREKRENGSSDGA